MHSIPKSGRELLIALGEFERSWRRGSPKFTNPKANGLIRSAARDPFLQSSREKKAIYFRSMELDQVGKKGLVALLALLLPSDDLEGGRWSASFIKYLTCALRVRGFNRAPRDLSQPVPVRRDMESTGMVLTAGRVRGRRRASFDLWSWNGPLT
jgi:hypothetical protein